MSPTLVLYFVACLNSNMVTCNRYELDGGFNTPMNCFQQGQQFMAIQWQPQHPAEVVTYSRCEKPKASTGIKKVLDLFKPY